MEDTKERDAGAGEGELRRREEIDPELESLAPGRPKKKRRHPFFMIGVIVIGLFLVYWLRVDFAYFFGTGTPRDLGEATEVDWSGVASNSYVHVSGFPNPTRVVKFSKRLHGGFYRLFPLVGTKNVFVQIHVEEEEEDAKEGGKKKGRSERELPGEFTGRAITFEDLEKTGITRSSYKNIREFFFEKFLMEVSGDTFLVMDGDDPRSYWVYPLLVALLAVFVLLNTVLFINWIVRRVRQRET